MKESNNANTSADIPTYTVEFVNNSPVVQTGMCFQNQSGGLPRGYFQLAWMTKQIAVTSMVQFQWQEAYSFVWAETGELAMGTVFTPNQTWFANLQTTNEVDLVYQPSGEIAFENQRRGEFTGTLVIDQARTIPSDTASIGIGMAGKAVYAIQAAANKQTAFTPVPEYWVGFGPNLTEGEVFNAEYLMGIAELHFPEGKFKARVVINADGTMNVDYE